MRDSQIGTYGVCALIVSFMLRVAALASLGDPGRWRPFWLPLMRRPRADAGFHGARFARSTRRHER